MTVTSRVTFAKFRKADPELDREAYPRRNRVGQFVAYPFKLLMRILCTGKLYFKKTNVLRWYKPRLFEFIDKVSGWLGLAPECAFVSYFPTFFGTFYYIQDPIVIKALFKEFRGSADANSLFIPTRAITTLFHILKEVFPDDHITEEDVIFTCSFENSKYYRNWLHYLFNGKCINSYRPIICAEAKKTLESWSIRCSEGASIPIFETALFTSRIITHLMFGQKRGGESLAQAVNFINWYAVYKLHGKLSQADKIKYKNSLKIFKQIVEEVISDQDAPLFIDQRSNSLTLAQKKSMAFTLFFAGQETTGVLLGSVLHFLARNKALQSTLRKKIEEKGGEDEIVRKEIETLINHSLARFPPSYAISRLIGKEDICLEYKLVGEEKLRKLVMKNGDLISARIRDAAQKIIEADQEKIHLNPDMWSAFGAGAHSCPGKNLALVEVREFILTVLQGYELSTNIQHEPHVIGQITLQFVEPITFTVIPIKKIQ